MLTKPTVHYFLVLIRELSLTKMMQQQLEKLNTLMLKGTWLSVEMKSRGIELLIWEVILVFGPVGAPDNQDIRVKGSDKKLDKTFSATEALDSQVIYEGFSNFQDFVEKR